MDFADECFNGLSLNQRIIITQKLIECKKVIIRAIIDDLAVVVSYKKYTREKVEKALEEQRNSTEKKVVKVKIPETETNCKHCGAALREGLRYCPYCGEKCTDDL